MGEGQGVGAYWKEAGWASLSKTDPGLALFSGHSYEAGDVSQIGCPIAPLAETVPANFPLWHFSQW